MYPYPPVVDKAPASQPRRHLALQRHAHNPKIHVSRWRRLGGKHALELLPDGCGRCGRPFAAHEEADLPAPAGRRSQHAGKDLGGVLAAHSTRARISWRRTLRMR